MSRWVVGVLGVLIVGTALHGILRDRLPPRTPEKVARIVSGLGIPDGSRVVVFEDEWNGFNGDGSTLIVLEPPRSVFDQLIAEATRMGYSQVSTLDSFPARVAARLGGPAARVALVEGTIANGRTIVLDRDSGRVVVYQVVS